jgi:hypothetical protein
MKGDRKRLKTEKTDLVGQMKQMYGTLKDKEAELRDFIRSYEQRNRDMLDNIKQVIAHFRCDIIQVIYSTHQTDK